MKNSKCSFYLLPFILLSLSCTNRTALQQYIHDADVVKVYIYSGSAIPFVHYETNDIDKIKLWSSYIDEKTDGSASCSYEGKLIFKASEDSTIMKFSLKDGCTQVAYTFHDTLFVKKLTPDGISFLNSLKKAQ